MVGEEERSSFLMLARTHLRKGGVALIGVNGPLGEAFAKVPFLGRWIPAGRGTGALVRLSGARVVPVTCTWSGEGRRIDIRFR